jgi:hypothetical protein
MHQNEMYYLVLVCACFGVMMLTLALGTIMEKRFVRQQELKAAATRR